MACVGQEICDIESKLHEMRPRVKSENAKQIPNLFMDICREQMTIPQFKAILDECNRRQRNGESIQATMRNRSKA